MSALRDARLSSKPDDYYLEKKRFSGFYNTNPDDILRGLDPDHVYVIGYSADVCLRFTSVDAYNRGYAVSLIYEGMESFRESKDHPPITLPGLSTLSASE